MQMVPPLPTPCNPDFWGGWRQGMGEGGTLLGFAFTEIKAESPCNTGNKEQDATNPLWLLSHVNTEALLPGITRLPAGDQEQPFGCGIWL